VGPQEKVTGLDLGIERATVVAVALVERKVEFLEIIALISDLEEEEDGALAEEVVDSTVEHLVHFQSRMIQQFSMWDTFFPCSLVGYSGT
jgi:hypothetical protein